MAWSDEARAAAIAARRAKSGSKGGTAKGAARKVPKGVKRVPGTIQQEMRYQARAKPRTQPSAGTQASTQARIAEAKAKYEKAQANPTKGDRLKNVAAVYGRGSPEYKAARRTLFGKGAGSAYGRRGRYGR